MKYIKDVIKHDIDGLLQIELDTFNDDRGQIWSVYEDCDFLPSFVEDKVTISNKDVLRGLHGDYETSKLISCLHGEIFLAVVDIRRNSETYREVKTFHLSADVPTMVFVPAGCLNGHACLTEKCVFFYKWTKKYDGPESQITVRWSDPTLEIPWPLKNPILSARDQSAKFLEG